MPENEPSVQVPASSTAPEGTTAAERQEQPHQAQPSTQRCGLFPTHHLSHGWLEGVVGLKEVWLKVVWSEGGVVESGVV